MNLETRTTCGDCYMDTLIQDYNIELAEPPCFPGAPMWSVKAHLKRDIGDVLPYLNARLGDCRYHHESRVLVWKKGERRYAFRPFEIAIAPVKDREEARMAVAEAVSMVNRIWTERKNIRPSFAGKEPARLLDIYKLLPQTNCGDCGYATCMAFANALREGKADLTVCKPLKESMYTENKNNLVELLSG